MNVWTLLRYVLDGLYILLILAAVRYCALSVVRLKRGLAEFRRSLEEEQNQPGPKNPYADMASLFHPAPARDPAIARRAARFSQEKEQERE